MSRTSWSGRTAPALLSAAVALAAGLGTLGCEEPAQPDAALDRSVAQRGVEAATYRITVTNTAEALQPLTPSVVAIHNPAARIFEVGSDASAELERVAESGMLDPLVSGLEGANQVFDVGVATGPTGPILPGESASLHLKGPPGARVSLVSMLVCTNDGFTGLDSSRLPEHVGESVTLTGDGYDAGTEQNTEASGDLVPPCVMATTGMEGGTGADQPGIAEDETVRHHPGIDGDTEGDDILDGEHEWMDPVATIEIERVS